MTEEHFRTVRLFKVLGNPLRYKILCELLDGPHPPSHLARAVRRPRPAVSRALGLLHWAGLVHTRTVGHHVIYRVRRPEIAALLDDGRSFIRRFELPIPPQSEAPEMGA